MLGRIVLGVAVVVSTGFAAPSRYATPVHDSTSVTMGQVRGVFEAPLFVVGASDHLVVLQRTTDRVQVRDAQGRVGWVDAAEVTLSAARVGYWFESAAVDRYMDSPDPRFVIGDPIIGDDAMLRGRSFSAEVRENIDKESLQRRAE